MFGTPRALRGGERLVQGNDSSLGFSVFPDLHLRDSLLDPGKGAEGQELSLFLLPASFSEGMRRVTPALAVRWLYLNERHAHNRSAMGSTGVGTILELGSKRNGLLGNLGHLPPAGQLPPFRQLARPLGLLHQHCGVHIDAVYLRNQQGVAHVFIDTLSNRPAVWPARPASGLRRQHSFPIILKAAAEV